VIAIIALLMAILLPTLARVRKQARAVACQANLRQWSILVSAHSIANPEVPLFWSDSLSGPGQTLHLYGANTVVWEQRYGPQVRKLLLCPMASRPSSKKPDEYHSGYREAVGTTFSAWWITPPPTVLEGRTVIGSYGHNMYVLGGGRPTLTWSPDVFWLTPATRHAPSVPLFFDTIYCRVPYPEPEYGPPPYEDSEDSFGVGSPWFINRHDGYVNYLFLDWSVRKVGLKELFGLRWAPDYRIDNPWTKAGGVQPDDWPPWLRRFKDY
jgi:prepilin-type processing-associated H-X9-DG protein